MAYKEIVTKAVIAKGKKSYKNKYTIEVDNIPSTILGCWIINHQFEAHEENNLITINGSFDVNVWYSYDNDTKTTVVSKKINYNEEEKLMVPNNDIGSKNVIVRALKQPTCISAKEDGNKINLDIEKELGLEVVGDTKVRIASVDEAIDDWINLDSDKDIDNSINPDYIKRETINK